MICCVLVCVYCLFGICALFVACLFVGLFVVCCIAQFERKNIQNKILNKPASDRCCFSVAVAVCCSFLDGGFCWLLFRLFIVYR